MILGQYKTLIDRSDKSPEEKKTAIITVAKAAGSATLVAIIMVVILGVILGLIGGEINEKWIEGIEGVSKIAASFCILKLSLKIPKWLKVYGTHNHEESKAGGDETLELGKVSLFWNVSWNIWREIAEAVIFLVPFFLSDDNLGAIPFSIILGTFIGGACGLGIYFLNTRFENMKFLAVFMATLTGLLAIGLLTYGVHEFEEVAEWEVVVYEVPGGRDGGFWSHKEFPMVIIKIFGYSDHPTIMMIICWWSGLFLTCGLHYRQFLLNKGVVDGMTVKQAEKKMNEKQEEIVENTL